MALQAIHNGKKNSNSVNWTQVWSSEEKLLKKFRNLVQSTRDKEKYQNGKKEMDQEKKHKENSTQILVI